MNAHLQCYVILTCCIYASMIIIGLCILFLVNITSGGEITFLFVSDDTDLGRGDLVSSVQVSCTLANDGQFLWSWTGPNGAALDVSRTSVLTADLTCTSILKINNLSISDSGQYTCIASLFDGFLMYPETARSSTIGINAEGNKCIRVI